MPLAGSPFAFLGMVSVAIVISVLALGELIGDKLPKVPPRIQAAPLLARAVSGALCGAALCVSAGRPWMAGLICGPLGSIAGAFSGYQVRRGITRRLYIPDFVIA